MTNQKSEKKLTWMGMKKEDLILELGRYEKKISDQWNEMKRLRAEVKDYRDGIAEVNLATNLAFEKVIRKYGSYGYGGKFVALPAETDIDSVMRLSAEKLGDLMVIAIKDKEED